MRHGPHQGAQKSTSTGTDALISSSKLSGAASTIQGSSVWQTLQRGTPDGLGRTRFFLPQLGQATIVPGRTSGSFPGGTCRLTRRRGRAHAFARRAEEALEAGEQLPSNPSRGDEKRYREVVDEGEKDADHHDLHRMQHAADRGLIDHTGRDRSSAVAHK